MKCLNKSFVIPFSKTNCNYGEIVNENMENSDDLSKDINEKKEIKESNDDLFINMSHEFKTPLNIICGATQLMEISLTNDLIENKNDKIIFSINSIKQSCFRLKKTVNNILDLNKIESNNFKLNFSRNDIVEEIENIVDASSYFIKTAKLNINFNFDLKEKIISYDKDQIQRVLLNLISNAIKYSKKGGEININLLDKGNAIEIEVADDGIGMSEQFLNIVFNKYSQEDKSFSRIAEGSGLGLFLVKSIIELHGGNISVKSILGQGSSFKFSIPSNIINIKSNSQKIIYDDLNEIINVEFSDIYLQN
ncbi:MAG: histidine kinase [Bacillota bacterium]|jgi:signal transduction histidine kinase|nr:histidine kinase [Bacillota bacterium]